jgi:hypothetical protein
MTSTVPYLPNVIVAQQAYVHWQTREHWLRKDLQGVRAAIWRIELPEDPKGDELTLKEMQLSWCRAEAEHKMVYYRSVLHAQGVQAI